MKTTHLALRLLFVCLLLGTPGIAAADEPSIQVAKVNAITWNYAIFVVFVTLIKVVAMIVGYLVVKLGYTTMMSGVRGNDAVELGGLGIHFKFKGVTPGLALGIIGVMMMAWALSTKSQFSANMGSETFIRQIEGTGTEPKPEAMKGVGNANEGTGEHVARPPKFPEGKTEK